MKKLLLASVAVSGLAFAATPAKADVDLELGGYFKGYGAFVSQDEATGVDANAFDIVRDTEIHIGGETTLDNGLTVGVHGEFRADGVDGSLGNDESYAYFSGDWGRVNFGNEDGAGYLLQVAAPSADENVDGIRQYIQPFAATGLGSNRLDYDMAPSGKSDKLTYLSPIMNGFQVGLTFSPDTDAANDGTTAAGGVGTDADVAGTIGQTYEIAARYEGQFNNIGVILGAGYTHGSEEGSSATTDDRKAWNVGVDLDIGAFGIGTSYSEDNQALENGDRNTLVIGVDYTTGPFKVGASYLNVDQEGGLDDFDRYTGGVTYEYGPGMSFRGSIQYVDRSITSASDQDGTAVLLGTQVNF